MPAAGRSRNCSGSTPGPIDRAGSWTLGRDVRTLQVPLVREHPDGAQQRLDLKSLRRCLWRRLADLAPDRRYQREPEREAKC